MKNRMFALFLAIFTLCALTAVPALAEKPSGKVTIESKSFALGVGWSWGDGKLDYKGKSHSFSVDGLSVLDAGYSSMSAVGEVFSLKNLADFSGTYTAVEGGVALGGGEAAMVMKNQNGVVIKLTATQQGVKLTIGPKGLQISLK